MTKNKRIYLAFSFHKLPLTGLALNQKFDIIKYNFLILILTTKVCRFYSKS